MKHVVLSSGLQESEIRPPVLMSEFRRLSIEESRVYFGDPEKLVEVACPACASEQGEEAFQKEGFCYRRCENCSSVFVSPRPPSQALEEYYLRSKASQFRVEHLAKDTAGARRIHLLRSHAHWMGRIVDEAGNRRPPRSYTSLGTTLPQIFEEIRPLEVFQEFNSYRPLPPFDQECERLGVNVRLEPPTDQDAASSFEKLEHQFSPLHYLTTAHDMLAPGGFLFFTTRTISGFDLQLLWDKAAYIFVPEHLNLLSIEGIEILIDRAGFQLFELSTPGQLDVQMVLHSIEQDPSIVLHPFFDYLIKRRGEEAHEDLQAFLQKHRLSSHIRVAASKPS